MSLPHDLVDRRFADFCRTGDPDALGEVFDHTAGRLLRVALWLCGNRADAEDALQRTFLQAIAARERFAPGRPALPWLLGLLSNQVHKLRRERPRAVRVAPPGPAADPAVAAATAELETAVEEVRTQLGESYREVLRLHLQQGLQAREIAVRLRRPAGTVRTQLVRALQALRARLPTGFVSGMAPTWILDTAAMPLGALRDLVLGEARRAAAAVPGALAIAGRSTRRVPWSAASAAALLCVATAALLWWQHASSPTAVPDYLVLATDPRPDGAPPVATRRSEDRDPGARTPAPAEPVFARVEVRLRWADDGTPAAGQVASCQTGAHPLREHRAATDAEGRCLFDHVEPGSVTAMCDGCYGRDRQTFALAAGAQRTVEVRCPRGIRVVGVVVDAEQRAVADAAIVASRLGMSRPPAVVARTDAAGRFLVQVPCGTDLHATGAGHGPSLLWPIEGKPGETQERTLQLRGPGGALAGTVRDLCGRALPFAQLAVGSLWPTPARHLDEDETGAQEPPGSRAVADAEGRFAIDGLAVGSWRVQAWAIGCAPWNGEAAIGAGRTTEREIVLPPGAAIAGTVRDTNGSVAGGAMVVLAADADRLGGVYLWTDAAGRFVADSLRPGTIAVQASKYPHGRDHADLDLEAGQVTTWDPILDAGRCVRGCAVDEVGRPLAGATVGWQRAGKHREAVRQADDRGRFVLTNVPDEPVDVVVYGTHWKTLATQPGVRAPCDDVVLRVDAAHTPNASLRGRIVDPHGAPRRARIWEAIDGFCVQSAADGTFLVEALPPGRYALAVEIDGARLPWRAVHLQPNECLDAGDFVLRPPCTLTVRATNADGSPVARGVVWTTTDDGLAAPHAEIHAGLARVAGLQPGRYRLRCSGDRQEGVAATEVVAGATNEVAVHVGPVVLCKVRCSAPYAVANGSTAEVVVDVRDGRPERRCAAPVTDDDHAGANLYLPPGRHVLRATFGETLAGETEVEVREPLVGEKVLLVHVPLRAARGR